MTRELGLTAGGGETDAIAPPVTFVFTDLEGSSRLWERHPEAMQDALARHDALLRNAMQSQGGRVVKTTGNGSSRVIERSEQAVT